MINPFVTKLSRIFNTKQFKIATAVVALCFWAATPFIYLHPKNFLKLGYLGIFAFNLFGGVGTVIAPALARHSNILLLALATAFGMSLNDSVAYLIGLGGEVILPHTQRADRIFSIIKRYGMIGLFCWSLIPLPYDIIGLIAGYVEFPYRRFWVATFLGKFVRFMIIGIVVRLVLH
ncbi:MAG: VTT domain-containing protein [candidate division WWE3 bacterium]|nr:VTT domain-containing protein [candidate division WWE3 bacterium]